MTISELANFAEILAATGVVASLIYVAFQIRENTKANRVGQRQNTTRQFADFMDLLLLNPDLAELHDRGRESPDSLSDEESVRFRRLLLRGFWYLSAQHQQYQIGAVRDEEWHETLVIIRAYLKHEGVRRWWQGGGRESFAPSFVRLVEMELTETGTVDRR